MLKINAKRIKSDISIKATAPIEHIVEVLSNAIGTPIQKNLTGKFEEFTGYEGEVLGIKVTLVSDPKNPKSDYDLCFYGSHGNEGETIDITSFMLAFLSKKTDLVCSKMV